MTNGHSHWLFCYLRSGILSKFKNNFFFYKKSTKNKDFLILADLEFRSRYVSVLAQNCRVWIVNTTSDLLQAIIEHWNEMWKKYTQFNLTYQDPSDVFRCSNFEASMVYKKAIVLTIHVFPASVPSNFPNTQFSNLKILCKKFYWINR